MKNNRNRIFSCYLIALLSFLKTCSSLDVHEVSEGSCHALRNVPTVGHINPAFLDRLTFIPGGSKYQLYRYARGHPHFHTLRDYEFFYQACLYKNISIEEGGGSTFGFGDRKLMTYDVRKRNRRDETGVAFVTTEKSGVHSGSKFTSKVTLTDNKDFAVLVHCWEDVKQKGWSIYSKTFLNSETRKLVEKHIEELGFDKKKIAFLEYDHCKNDKDDKWKDDKEKDDKWKDDKEKDDKWKDDKEKDDKWKDDKEKDDKWKDDKEKDDKEKDDKWKDDKEKDDKHLFHRNHQSTRHGNHPSNRHGNHPSNRHGNHPSNRHGNHQSTGHGNHPSTGHGNHPSTGHGNHPSTGHGNHPYNLQTPVHVSHPSAVFGSLPVHGNLVSAVHGNNVVPVHGSHPTLVHGGHPTPVHGSHSSAFHGSHLHSVHASHSSTIQSSASSTGHGNNLSLVQG